MEENVSSCEDQTELAWTVQSSYMHLLLIGHIIMWAIIQGNIFV